MVYVYVLKSVVDESLYIGYTKDLVTRFTHHNQGKNKATRSKKPWKLVYYEAFLSKKDAMERESQLKQYKSAYGFLKRRIARSLDRA